MATVFVSCEKADESSSLSEPREYYDFANVDFSDATTRLQLFDELTAKMRTANTVGVTVSANELKEIFSKEPDTAIDLYDVCWDLIGLDFRVGIMTEFDDLENLSANFSTPNTGTSGAGIAEALDGSTYLLDASGIELGEYLRQKIAGAVFYFNAIDYQFAETFIPSSLEQEEVKRAAQIEVMAKSMDVVFGYFGAPLKFPQEKTPLYFYAAMSDEFDALLESNQSIMDALIKVRATAGEGDLNTLNEGVFELRGHWEKIIAASMLHSVNEMKSGFTDRARRNHNWSIVKGQVESLQYNPSQMMSATKRDSVITFLGVGPDVMPLENLDEIQRILSESYELEAIKDDL